MVYKRISHPPTKYWKTQLPVDYITTGVADPIVINTWYTVVADLSGGKPCKIHMIQFEQTNNGASAEDIVFEMTVAHPVTGVMTALTFTINSADGAINNLWLGRNLLGGWFNAQISVQNSTFGYSPAAEVMAIFAAFSAVSLIRVRQTSVVDVTNAQLEVNLTWEKFVES